MSTMSPAVAKLEEAEAILRDSHISATLEYPGDLYVYGQGRAPTLGFRVSGSVEYPPLNLEVFLYLNDEAVCEGISMEMPDQMPDAIPLDPHYNARDLAYEVCRVIAILNYPEPQNEDPIERELREQDEEDAAAGALRNECAGLP